MYFPFQNLFVIFSIILPFCESRRIVKATNLKCISLNENYLIFRNCSLKAINRDVFELNVHAFLPRPAVTNIKLNIDIKKRTVNGGVGVLNITIDACEFLKNPGKYPIANICYTVFGFDRFSNMNHTCPYSGNVYIRGYRVDEKILSLIPFPYSDYSIVLTWIIDKLKTGRNEIGLKYFERPEYNNRD